MKQPKERVYATSEGSTINCIFCGLGELVIKRWKIILFIAVAIALWSFLGVHNIEVDTSWKRFFKKKSEILTSQRFIKSNFGSASTINVSFLTDENSDLEFRNLKTLAYVDTVEQWIRNKNVLGQTNSLVGYIKRANQLLNRNDPAAYRLPDNDADLLKILLMFKMSKFTKSLSNVITEDYKHTNIVIKSAGVSREASISEFKNFIKDFTSFINDTPFEGITVDIAGVELIYVSLVDYLVRSQLLSILLSIVIVFFIITYTFKSFTYGLFGLIPIIFGLLLNFGAMSYFKVPLDFITSMIASIAVGLGVDNSIHYLIRFTRTQHNLPLDERIKNALINSGIPIFFTSFTLIAGFCVLLFSSFKPILYFGLLISLTMLGCLIGVLFILPAFIYFIKPKAILQGRAE